MAHRERFMQEVEPGRWVVQCRVCPKRRLRAYGGGKRVFGSARECHDWWRQHAGSKVHLDATSPTTRERVEADRERHWDEDALMKAIFGKAAER